MVVFSIREQQSPISTCLNLIQPTAMLSTRRQGVTSGAPLACRARWTHSHPGYPSFLPSQPVGAHFKRPQWPQQQVYSQTCRSCHLSYLHQNKPFIGNTPSSKSQGRGDQATTKERVRAHLKTEQPPHTASQTLFLFIKEERQPAFRLT